MEKIISLLAFFGCGVIFYWLTPKLMRKFIGDVIWYRAANGKNYKVLKRPNETEKEAITRLRAKVRNAGTI